MSPSPWFVTVQVTGTDEPARTVVGAAAAVTARSGGVDVIWMVLIDAPRLFVLFSSKTAFWLSTLTRT